MAQTQRLGTHRTSVFTDNGDTKVVYHNTCIVKFNAARIRLETGGWNTNSTKTRMNQASNQFSLGYRVFQKDFDWFIDYKGATLEFVGNGTTLLR